MSIVEVQFSAVKAAYPMASRDYYIEEEAGIGNHGRETWSDKELHKVTLGKRW